MKSRSGVCWAALSAAVVLLAAVGVRADSVTIGNPGNAAASATNTSHWQSGAYGYGAVPYTYQISRTAASIAEWSEFNSVLSRPLRAGVALWLGPSLERAG